LRDCAVSRPAIRLRVSAVGNQLIDVRHTLRNQRREVRIVAMPDIPKLSDSPELPDLAKWLLWLRHQFQENWQALMKPPVLAALCIIGYSAYSYGVSRNADAIDVKNERIYFLNDQLSAYKDRLGGATPDQAAKEILALRSRIDEDESKLRILLPAEVRTLTPGQKELILSKRDDILKLGKPLWIFSLSIGDSGSYAWDFMKLFRDANIPTMGIMPQPMCRASEGESGVMVGLREKGKPSVDAARFVKILADAGLNVKYTHWIDAPDGTLDFNLFICP